MMLSDICVWRMSRTSSRRAVCATGRLGWCIQADPAAACFRCRPQWAISWRPPAYSMFHTTSFYCLTGLPEITPHNARSSIDLPKWTVGDFWCGNFFAGRKPLLSSVQQCWNTEIIILHVDISLVPHKEYLLTCCYFKVSEFNAQTLARLTLCRHWRNISKSLQEILN